MAKLKANCPICDGQVNLPTNVEETEILTCPDCQNRVVVAKANPRPILEKAPEIEEDWGE
jgi:lysine biosynthesis protein LysW